MFRLILSTQTEILVSYLNKKHGKLDYCVTTEVSHNAIYVTVLLNKYFVSAYIFLLHK